MGTLTPSRYVNHKVIYFGYNRVLNRPNSMPHFNFELFLRKILLARSYNETHRCLIIPVWRSLNLYKVTKNDHNDIYFQIELCISQKIVKNGKLKSRKVWKNKNHPEHKYSVTFIENQSKKNTILV